MADIGSLIVKIGADASGLQKAFDDLGGSAKQFERGLESIGKIAATAFLSATTAAIAMTIAAGKQAEELDQLAATTGINTDRLQEYDVMLHRAGLSGQDLAVIMKNVAQSLDQARQGTGTAGDRFRQLGIDIRTVTSADDLLRKIVVSSGNLADVMGKTTIMTDLLGRSWQQALKAFQDGERGLSTLSTASRNLGETLTTSQIATLKAMDDQIDDTILAYTRFGQQLGVSLAPNIQFITELLKDLMVIGANHVAEFGLAWDVLATKVLHFGLQMQEVAGLIVSGNLFAPEAWKQTLETLTFIGKESDKQVARLRLAFEMAKVVAPTADTRKQPPAMIDTAKQAQAAQALVDAQLKASEGLFKNQDALAKASFTHHLAQLEAAKSAGIRTDEEVAVARQAATERMDTFTADSLTRQLANYRTFMNEKAALFTHDTKGQADRAKFAVEAAQKETELINQLSVAQMAADTNRIQSGAAVLAATKTQRLVPLQDEIALATADFQLQQAFYAQAPSMIGAANSVRASGLALLEQEAALRAQVIQQTITDEQRKATLMMALDAETHAKRMALVQQFPTFMEQQLQAVVASNAFSMGAIVNTWTSGIATMILKGGDLKAAWEATQQALLQGILNTLVQWGAEFALTLLKNAALKETADAGMIASHTATETAKTLITTTAEGARLALTIATQKAVSASAIASLASIGTVAQAGIAIMLVAMESMAAMMAAIATALIAGVYTSWMAKPVAAAAAGLAKAAPLIAAGATAAIQGAIAASTKVASAAIVAPLASGGIVTRPTLALIGEAGPEAVIPLSGRRIGGEGRTIVIHNYLEADGREFARVVTKHLPRAFRMDGAPA